MPSAAELVPGWWPPVLFQESNPCQVHDFAFVLDVFHGLPVGLFLLVCQVLLDGSPAVQCIDWFPQVGVIHELSECILLSAHSR